MEVRMSILYDGGRQQAQIGLSPIISVPLGGQRGRGGLIREVTIFTERNNNELLKTHTFSFHIILTLLYSSPDSRQKLHWRALYRFSGKRRYTAWKNKLLRNCNYLSTTQ